MLCGAELSDENENEGYGLRKPDAIKPHQGSLLAGGIGDPMSFSTQAGFLNPNNQQVLGPTGMLGTDHGQKVYVLECQTCAHVYGANGTDIAIRRCPACGGGKPGFNVTTADIIEMASAAPIKRKRNPDWTRDELILALDVYFDLPSPDQHKPQVIALSALLNQLWATTEFAEVVTMRNPSGVSMKLGNFQRFDRAFQNSGRKGLANGGRGDQEVWDEFAGDRARLAATAAAIRAALDQAPQVVAAPDYSADVEAPEGAILTRLHHYRERDPSLAKKRKAQALAAHGRLACEACDFDFVATYGERGLGFIECHHTKALETLQAGAKTKLSELALLCANCHRMIHARRPWLSIDELKALVQI